ncbi:MAG: hypothetical protein IJD70_09555 [Clostridia bacterium]|nr:hypothetical protein [Clostridia bacterium]
MHGHARPSPLRTAEKIAQKERKKY